MWTGWATCGWRSPADPLSYPAITATSFTGPPLRTGGWWPSRKALSSSASRRLAWARKRSLTGPKPRIRSGIEASSTAVARFSGVEAGQQLLDQRLVVRDQLALDATLLGVAERVEPVPRSRLQPREQPEGAQHPGAVGALPRLAVTGSVPRDQRRGQVEAELPVALEHARRCARGSRSRCRAGRPRTRPCRPAACGSCGRPPPSARCSPGFASSSARRTRSTSAR